MAVTDVSNLKKKRQQKKMMRFLAKVIIIVIVAGTIAALILTKDSWYPNMKGLLGKVPSGNNTAELAGGQFPLIIGSGAEYQLETVDNAVAVLDDSHFNVYNNNGQELFSHQHTLANPILQTAEKKALIYDLGGNSFSLMSKYKEVYSKTLLKPILIAKLSNSDQAAIVTKDDKFLSYLRIYNNVGEEILSYGSITRIIDVTFDSTDTGCYITTIDSRNGVIVSQILYYRLDRVDRDASGNPVPVWKTDYLETLPYSVRTFGEENIIVFGNNLCAYYDINGNLVKVYNYDYTVTGFDSDSNTAAMVFNLPESRESLLVTLDKNTSQVYETTLDFIADNIQVSDRIVYIQNNSGIISYTPFGAESSSAKLSEDYDDFRKLNNQIFLMGYDEINRIDFN